MTKQSVWHEAVLIAKSRNGARYKEQGGETSAGMCVTAVGLWCLSHQGPKDAVIVRVLGGLMFFV